MTKRSPNRKGQFSIIAALLVAIVLVTALITTYSLVRNSPFEQRPQVLGAVDEINVALRNTLEFTVGYYGSILQVTGNSTYAESMAVNYLYSGLIHIARMHPDWSPSFAYNFSEMNTNWFMPKGLSSGSLSVTYSLPGLGMDNVRFSTSCELNATISSAFTNSTHTRIRVTKEGGLPLITLDEENFSFYSYDFINSIWTTIHPPSILAFGNGTYIVRFPAGVDIASYMVQVVDARGIMVTASRVSYYTYTPTWDSLYSGLKNDVVAVEALQNGTLRWLGQAVTLTTQGRPLPPLPVRSFRINQTVAGVNREVPFQVEDWGSSYKVALGLSSNASVFSNKNMLVFLLNHNVTSFRIWWDGRDSAVQTSYATTNRYFTADDVSSPDNGVLTNGRISLSVQRVSEYGVTAFKVTSNKVGSAVTATARFMRINNKNATYGSGTAYVIHHGIVRDIVQQEAEWSGGVSGSPNVYSQIIITLPANATYYTYSLRTMFISSTQARTVTDLCPLKLVVSTGQPRTENGKAGSYPTVSSATGLFYNSSTWIHHWSQFITGTQGAGIMFTDSANRKLYTFDSMAGGTKTGALKITNSSGRIIELLPISSLASKTFQTAVDATWHGAVVNFDNTDPIYRTSDQKGLWIIAENPPTIAIN